MGSSSSSQTGGGGDYKKEVYFDPEADSPTGKDYRIPDSELKRKMEEVADLDERIMQVIVLTHPLTEWQVSDAVMYHAFVVIETDHWWWSFEKNSENVTIQRSKKREYVADKYRRKDRITPITYVKKTTNCRGTVRDLIFYLYKENLVFKEYSALLYNCKHFASKVYWATTGIGESCSVGYPFGDLP